LRDAREAEALAHIKALARGPRPAGSPDESLARRYCRQSLEGNGFSVTEEPFTFSAAVGRWATPLAGAILAGAMVAVVRGYPIAWLAGTAVALGIVGRWAATRGVLELPLDRQQSTNLVAIRGEPEIWLVAHIDSKSQPTPILVRAAAILALIVVVIVLVALGVVEMMGRALPTWTPWLAGLGAIAALIVSSAWVGQSSPGAADNATGVATLLSAVDGLPQHVSLGVLITSAEELGLAGARAWARGRQREAPGRSPDAGDVARNNKVDAGASAERTHPGPARRAAHLSAPSPSMAAPPLAINIDTVDEHGTFRCMAHGSHSHLLAVRVARAGQAISRPVVVRSLIPGILTDGVALADAGWRVVTLSRGNLGTLWRIHTPRDSVDRLTGRGVASAALLVRELVERSNR
jgi:hypothetical protein